MVASSDFHPVLLVSCGFKVPRGDDLAGRLVLCARLAHVLGVLHRFDITYGDLSLNNVMFTSGPPGHIMLVDCDAAFVNGGERTHIEQLTGQPAERILALLHAGSVPVRSVGSFSPWYLRQRSGS